MVSIGAVVLLFALCPVLAQDVLARARLRFRSALYSFFRSQRNSEDEWCFGSGLLSRNFLFAGIPFFLSIPNVLSNNIFHTVRPFLLFASCFIAVFLKDKLFCWIKKHK